MALNVVILAAGKGTRMRSAKPKVLLDLAGRSLLQHVIEAVAVLGSDRVVVVTGHGAEAVEAALAGSGATTVRQSPQRGTGHAVLQALPWLATDDRGTTLVLNGDTPLVQPATLQALVAASAGDRLALLTVTLDEPAGYGRIVRSGPGAAVTAIVEDKDCSAVQRDIDEVYAGLLAAPAAALARWLPLLQNDNAQAEFYLTDVVALAVLDGTPVVAVQPADPTEVLGVNTPQQLAALERSHQLRLADALLTAGVRLRDPARIDVRGTLRCGADVEIDVGCVFEGSVDLADDVRIGAHCVLRNAVIGSGTVVHPFCHIDGGDQGVRVGGRAVIGPYARLRPGAELADEVHIGNFVEVKNSRLGRGAKANHLAYLGDASVGEQVNFGAGSITANYDGVHKHRTVIGDGAHVGSNCVLVAPVTIGAGATIGGGSTITRPAPPEQLTVSRARQTTVAGWQRPKK